MALERIGRILDRRGIGRETVTLVLDEGPAALADTLELQGVGWTEWRRCSRLSRRSRCDGGRRASWSQWVLPGCGWGRDGRWCTRGAPVRSAAVVFHSRAYVKQRAIPCGRGPISSNRSTMSGGAIAVLEGSTAAG